MSEGHSPTRHGEQRGHNDYLFHKHDYKSPTRNAYGHASHETYRNALKNDHSKFKVKSWYQELSFAGRYSDMKKDGFFPLIALAILISALTIAFLDKPIVKTNLQGPTWQGILIDIRYKEVCIGSEDSCYPASFSGSGIEHVAAAVWEGIQYTKQIKTAIWIMGMLLFVLYALRTFLRHLKPFFSRFITILMGMMGIFGFFPFLLDVCYLEGLSTHAVITKNQYQAVYWLELTAGILCMLSAFLIWLHASHDCDKCMEKDGHPRHGRRRSLSDYFVLFINRVHGIFSRNKDRVPPSVEAHAEFAMEQLAFHDQEGIDVKSDIMLMMHWARKNTDRQWKSFFRNVLEGNVGIVEREGHVHIFEPNESTQADEHYKSKKIHQTARLCGMYFAYVFSFNHYHLHSAIRGGLAVRHEVLKSPPTQENSTLDDYIVKKEIEYGKLAYEGATGRRLGNMTESKEFEKALHQWEVNSSWTRKLQFHFYLLFLSLPCIIASLALLWDSQRHAYMNVWGSTYGDGYQISFQNICAANGDCTSLSDLFSGSSSGTTSLILSSLFNGLNYRILFIIMISLFCVLGFVQAVYIVYVGREESNYMTVYKKMINQAQAELETELRNKNHQTHQINLTSEDQKKAFDDWINNEVPDTTFYNNVIKILYTLLLASILMMSIYGALYGGAKGYLKNGDDQNELHFSPALGYRYAIASFILDFVALIFATLARMLHLLPGHRAGMRKRRSGLGGIKDFWDRLTFQAHRFSASTRSNHHRKHHAYRHGKRY